jgi:hypothetical protein
VALTRIEFAERAGVSRQSIHHALRKRWLIAEPDGTLDKQPANQEDLARHSEAST